MAYHPEGNSADHPGMSLRDYFAAKAMPGILVAPWAEDWTFGRCAEAAFKVADAMLKAREQQS
jgi:hypothetical protein